MHNMGEKFAILLRENCESTLLLDLTCIIYVHVKYTVAQIRYLNITLNIYTQYKKELNLISHILAFYSYCSVFCSADYSSVLPSVAPGLVLGSCQ